MPPLSPAIIVGRFQKRISDVLRDFDELRLAVHQKKRQASLETMIAEQSVLLTAVLWETFINDLIISYVIQDPKACFENYEERFRQSLTDKFRGLSKWISLDFPESITFVQVERLLDPKGWNLSATSAQSLADLANRHLSGVQARKFSLQVDDRDFVDYLVSLRNYLSHRSAGSRSEFVRSVKLLKAGGVNQHLSGHSAETDSATNSISFR